VSWGQDPSPYGNPLRELWNAGAQAIGSRMSAVGAAVTSAKDKVVQLAGAAADALASAAATAAKKTAAAALVTTEAGVCTAAYAGAKVAAPVVSAASSAVNAPINAAKAIKNAFSPQQPALVPCVACAAKESATVRAARIEKRNALIAEAGASPDPAVRAAGAELKSDMKAVELASLSEDTCAQYDPNVEDKTPPSPWKAMTEDEMRAAHIVPKDVADAKAVIYKCPDDFPYDPKTVVAFRGTTAEGEDIIADHDQALGLKNKQYEAAKALGASMDGNPAFDGAEVTGHSLGGGKAQAAGIAGGLRGQMFNSAGLNPKTMGAPAGGLDQYAKDFDQYRSAGGLSSGGGDPLTGLQNSFKAQSVAFRTVQGISAVANANQWASGQLGLDDYLASKVPDAHKELAGQLLTRSPALPRKKPQTTWRSAAASGMCRPRWAQYAASRARTPGERIQASRHSTASSISTKESSRERHRTYRRCSMEQEIRRPYPTTLPWLRSRRNRPAARRMHQAHDISAFHLFTAHGAFGAHSCGRCRNCKTFPGISHDSTQPGLPRSTRRPIGLRLHGRRSDCHCRAAEGRRECSSRR
jgi:hypothetical protein